MLRGHLHIAGKRIATTLAIAERNPRLFMKKNAKNVTNELLKYEQKVR
jgi:hypothetical protein